jgi:predicted MFS family arabinose efflux permease
VSRVEFNAENLAVSSGNAPRAIRHRWRQMAILTAASGGDSSEASVLTSLFPAIQASLGLSLTDLGLLTAGSKIAGALLSGFWIWLAPRWNRKAVLVVTSSFCGIWGIAAGFANGFTALMVFYAALAVGTTGAAAIVTQIMSDLFEDGTRGRAVGIMFAVLIGLAALAGPLLGQLSGIEGGWRVGFWLIGALNFIVAILIFLFFQDPGIGASEIHLQVRSNANGNLTWESALSIFRIPSFNLMLLSRLLSGHLIVAAFGVVYLTQVYGFDNKTATLLPMPFGGGYIVGAMGGSVIVDNLHRRWPRSGRVLFLQLAQVAFAVAAFFGTQFNWGSIYIFGLFWFLLGMFQGVNPCVNRPIVMSVVAPELRGWAFVVMVAMVESLGWALYNFGAGWFGDRYGLRNVFLVVTTGVMLVNAALITLLYFTYAPDRRRMEASLDIL